MIHPYHPIQVAGGALCSQMINIEAPSWLVLGCRTSTKVTRKNISHENQEISILMIGENQSKVNTSSTSHRELQRSKDKTREQRTKKQKPEKIKKQNKCKSSMDKSASLTPVQGPSTAAHMIVTSLPQLPTDFISSLQWVMTSDLDSNAQNC
jgi:altronate dehydratase